MAKCQVKAHALYDTHFDNWDSEVHNRWDYQDFLDDPRYFEEWISFCSLVYDPDRNLIYCGLAAFSSDILYSFDPRTKQFKSLHYERISDRYDAKFHRSLVRAPDGIIYGGIAQFHDIDRQFEAPGGAIIRYDPASDDLRKIAIPLPHCYIQGIALDAQRNLLYGITLSPEKLFQYDLSAHETRELALIGSSLQMAQPHLPAVDDDGGCWGTWGLTRAWASQPGPDAIRLFRYDPESKKMTWFQHGLPRLDEDDLGAVDGIINGGDGYLYAGTGAGALARIDSKTGEVKLLGKPCPARRLAGLAVGKDGLLYGAGGDDGQGRIFAYDREKEELFDLGPIYDEERKASPDRIHDIVITDDLVIYAGENDNHCRSGYLWECKVQW